MIGHSESHRPIETRNRPRNRQRARVREQEPTYRTYSGSSRICHFYSGSSRVLRYKGFRQGPTLTYCSFVLVTTPTVWLTRPFRVHFWVMNFDGVVSVHLLVCTLCQSGSTTPFVYDLECVRHVAMYIGQGLTLTYCSFV